MTTTTATIVKGTITEKHVGEVADIFGKEVAEKLKNCEGKTFLDILREMGKI